MSTANVMELNTILLHCITEKEKLKLLSASLYNLGKKLEDELKRLTYIPASLFIENNNRIIYNVKNSG